jgi:hypothetical protein
VFAPAAADNQNSAGRHDFRLNCWM